LQPLIENSIKHGLEPRISGGTITLRSRIDESGMLVIEVEDDGVGMSIERNDVSGAESLVRQGAGIGMKNVRERLEVQYGGSAKVEVNSRPGRGTKVTLCMPVLEPSMWPEGGMQVLEAAVNVMDNVISRATRARG
jgi:two-component system LytT family sensor kinase